MTGTTQKHQIAEKYRADPRLKHALFHRTRIEILYHLVRKQSITEGVTDGELRHALDIPASRLEYHLKVLADADLIKLIPKDRHEKRGRVYAVAADDSMQGRE